MVKSGKSPWTCSRTTMVELRLHHGAVKTPPWWSGAATVVKFLRHRGVPSNFTMVKFSHDRDEKNFSMAEIFLHRERISIFQL